MDLWTVYRIGLDEARRAGVIAELAERHAWAMAAMAYYGFTAPERPDIVSGYRSPDKQFDMLVRWNNGDRRGLAAKPAVRSWHMVRRAIDVQTDVTGFPYYVQLMKYTGARWGGDFQRADTPHFDLPGPQQPPTVYELVA